MTKNIVITGTSRGIGYELVKQFAQQGHQVLALSRNDGPVKGLKLNNVHAFCFDLGDAEAYEKVEAYISKHWGHVDVLINNAGKVLNKPFAKTTVSDFEEVYRTNVFGVAELTRSLISYMGKNSHVVMMSSMGGVQGSVKFAGLSAYSSSKAAVITLTELLAEEYKDSGISFNVLALGAVQTEMLEEAFPGYKAPITPEEIADYIVDFSLKGQKFYNGKLLQISNSTP